MSRGIYRDPTELPGTQLIGFIYNKAYGGFGYSQLALDEYSKRTTSKKNKYGPYRTDQVMVDIVKELGAEANGQYAELEIVYIEPKYQAFIDVDEYDGKETVGINWNMYLLANIYKTIEATDSAEDKVAKIRTLFDENPPDSHIKSLNHIYH